METLSLEIDPLTMPAQNHHIPVMSKEIQEYLNLPANGCFVDCTLGLGGHSAFIAQQLDQGTIIGIDRDATSIKKAQERLGPYAQRCKFVHNDFRNIDHVLNDLGIEKVDGMLFDFGISSFQLDNPDRGFSFQHEGPLDMRMNQDNFLSAYDLINSLSEIEISKILKKFGEERWHNRIARLIVSHRPIQSTKELSDIVLKATPSRHRRQKIHPATRTFQAFRIAVNRELESIEIALDKSIDYLKVGGRICVISFHSLEDRIVKQKFREFAKEEELRLVCKKPLQATEEEVSQNSRARSAKLRVAEKI